VHVVAPEKQPLERVFGPQMGDFVRKLHEENGVVFHLEDTSEAITAKQVKLKSGKMLDADFVVVGVGVHPRIALAEKAGLAIDRGVPVEHTVANQRADILAAGDIARCPIRIRRAHPASSIGSWPSGRVRFAALNMMGISPAVSTPCHSSGASITTCRSTIGTCREMGRHRDRRDIGAKDCVLRYRRNGKGAGGGVDLPPTARAWKPKSPMEANGV